MRTLLCTALLLSGCSGLPVVERSTFVITVPEVSERSDYARCVHHEGEAVWLSAAACSP